MVRQARASEAEAVASVTSAAFGFPAGGERWVRTRRMVENTPERYLVIEREGEIAGALRIDPHLMQIGRCRVWKGDVADVCVRPDLQGMGLGTELMQAAIEKMRAGGIHISRLGGLVKFYSRFGYVRFPRGGYEMPIEPAQGGDRLLTCEDVLRLPRDVERYVRRYEPRRDWHACQELWLRFNEGRTGAPAREWDPSRPAPEAGPDPRGFSFVFDDGQVRGYVIADRAREGQIFRLLDPRVVISEGAYDVGRPEALWGPVRACLLAAARFNIPLVAARLPFDPVVERALMEGGVLYRRVELMGGAASNMICVIDLGGLLEAIAAELSRRWKTAGAVWEGALAVEVDGQMAVVEVESGAVNVRSAARAAWSGPVVEMDTWTFGMLLLGLRPWRVLRGRGDGKVPGEIDRVVDALFPPQPTATGLWG